MGGTVSGRAGGSLNIISAAQIDAKEDRTFGVVGG